ncbi:glycosyltransferase family 1 protein [Pseudolabrys taiwanensis]|uniref:Glycosyltransferase family 1 protein n=1 Tax=Pseudolabrys taiwanensis TaxID=331696 RepID=A0A345ZQ74_9HYPH|nr:glycosyltransferase family 4 protein [Pseudolabrys taiwanensis]AXK79071.1 glycosyltransferase family 1 protein [Pseudolabrys taiwanensis]
MATAATSPDTCPVLAYVVTQDWYFLSHRLPMARAAREAGFDVHVITHVNKGGAAIEAEGFRLHPVVWRRGSLHPLGFLSNICAVRRVFRRIKPSLVHNVALQPTVVGSLAALGLPPRRLNALAGLGFTFTSTTLKARLVRPVLEALLRFVLRDRRAAVLVQNPDDRAAIGSLGVPADRIFTIPGSGVETDRLVPLPEPPGAITMAFVGRLLDDKGIRPLVAAQALLGGRGTPVCLLIAGDPDPANPASIPADEIAGWARQPGIEVLGHVGDIRDVWSRAHIAVLPSRREGLPKSLLEAAACGRPIVATDVPGCREVARPGINALLVPPDSPAALADAIERLARDAALRHSYGAAGRHLVETEFSAEKIGRDVVSLYDRLLTYS